MIFCVTVLTAISVCRRTLRYELVDLSFVQVIILENVLKGLRYLPVNSVIDLFSLLLNQRLPTIASSAGIEMGRSISLIASSCLSCGLILIRRLIDSNLSALLLIFLSGDESIEPLEGIDQLTGEAQVVTLELLQ